mgnify:CR=1 FL=1
MKVAFYLGSFNPPHYGHLMVINEAVQNFKMDKVIVVPAMHNPTKKIKPAPFDLRYSWMERVCSKFGNCVEVDRIEESMIPPFYSYATLHALRNKYCNDETYLLIGEDLVNEIPDWMNGGQILNDWDLLIVDRPNTSMSSSEYRRYPLLLNTYIPTDIRDEVLYYYLEHGEELELQNN